MLIDFFLTLRKSGIKTTLKELLDLIKALNIGVIKFKTEDFYYLSRSIMVKDEKYYDRFDRAFSIFFNGMSDLDLKFLENEIPEEWLRKQFEKTLSKEERDKIQSLNDLEELMKKFMETFNEQRKRHQGGSKWIGTGGTSPYGAYGSNPFGIRIGQEGNRNFSAAKVWDKRKYINLDDDVEVGTRNMKVVLKKLRKFTRINGEEELDIKETIRKTADNGGFVDIRLKPERKNQVKVLLFFDVGGSMDSHVSTCEELFSAARTEFKHLEYYYFHNCIYETVWRENRRRQSRRLATWDLLHTYPSDYKLIIVGDAAMSPYEIAHPGGSVEHWNEESGEVWLRRLVKTYPSVSWLNPLPKDRWRYFQSAGMVSELLEGRMFPLTLDGLELAMRSMNN